MTDPLHPIRTVSGPGLTLSQGPTVGEVMPQRPDYLPTDMHGTLAVRTGTNTIATGKPVPSVRGNDE